MTNQIFYGFTDPEHIKRERRKAQELRKSSWWKQQIGLGLCYHCGERFSKELLTMDHLIPIARGGKSTKKNCVVACKDCNSKKGHQMGVEITMREMEERGELSHLQETEEADDNSHSGSDAVSGSDFGSDSDTDTDRE